MIDIGIKIDKIKIEVKTPINRGFWYRVGDGVRKVIYTRTYERGEDVDRHTFKPYSKAYAEKKRKEGLPSFRPNLSFSNRMLNAMSRGLRPHKRGVKLVLSGEEGGKAYANEKRGRVFFDLSKKNLIAVVKDVDKELVRLNDLK